MSDPYRPKPGIFLGPPPDPISVDPAQVQPPSNLAPPSTTAGMTDPEGPKADTLADVARDILATVNEGEWVNIDTDFIEPGTILVGPKTQARLRAALAAHDQQREAAQ